MTIAGSTTIGGCDYNEDQVQLKSGSPGYIAGYPLKIAFSQGASGTGALNSYIKGYEINGVGREGTDRGMCLENMDDGVEYEDPIIKFKTDLSYGCMKKMDLKELEEYCSDTDNRVAITPASGSVIPAS